MLHKILIIMSLVQQVLNESIKLLNCCLAFLVESFSRWFDVLFPYMLEIT